MCNYSVLTWLPIDHRPLSTGRYLVAHRGHAEVMYFLSPHDHEWGRNTKLGWQEDTFGATYCAKLPEYFPPAK